MVYKESFQVQSNDKMCTFHNVTAKAKEILIRSGIKKWHSGGVFHHTTCCVITQECAFDMSMTGLETLQQDLVEVFEAIVSHLPQGRDVFTSRSESAEIRLGARRGRPGLS